MTDNAYQEARAEVYRRLRTRRKPALAHAFKAEAAQQVDPRVTALKDGVRKLRSKLLSTFNTAQRANDVQGMQEAESALQLLIYSAIEAERAAIEKIDQDAEAAITQIDEVVAALKAAEKSVKRTTSYFGVVASACDLLGKLIGFLP